MSCRLKRNLVLSCPSLKESSSLRNSRGRNEASTSKAFRTAVAGSPKHKGKHFLWILFRVFTPYWSSKLNLGVTNAFYSRRSESVIIFSVMLTRLKTKMFLLSALTYLCVYRKIDFHPATLQVSEDLDCTGFCFH